MSEDLITMRPWEFLYDIFLFANNACRIILVSASSCVLNNSGTSSIRTRADGHHSFRILETPGKLYLVIVSHGETCVMFQGVVTRKPNKTGFVFGNRKKCFQSGMGLLSMI